MILEMAGAAAIAAFVSLVACRVLMAAGPMDQPGARKDHATPTPTSGGIGIAIGFGVALMYLALFSVSVRAEISPRGAVLLSLASAISYIFLIIGFWDDARPLSARLKFLLFAAASLAAAGAVGVVREFPAFDGVVWVAPYWLGLIGTALWIFTMVNGVNFMDGANGLAMGSMAIALTALAAISYVHGSVSGTVISLCAVGALLGFLFWNFPGGRLFAGDSGALFAGSVGALTSLIVIHRAGISPIIPAILFFPLLADVLVTLAWRAYRRRSLLDGHSEHLYQIARRGGMSHAEVSLIYWASTAACGVIGFLLARDQGLAPLIVLGALAATSIAVSTAVRRFADRAGVGGV